MRPLRPAGRAAAWLRAVVGMLSMVTFASCAGTDHTSVAIQGPIPISLASRHGPVEPAGPFAAVYMAALQAQMAAAAGTRGVVCRPGPCWRGYTAQSGFLYVVFNPSDTTTCFLIRRLVTATLAPRRLRIDVTVHNECDGFGNAARPRGADNLLAVPLRALGAGDWTVVIRERTPSTPYLDVGQTVVTIQ